MQRMAAGRSESFGGRRVSHGQGERPTGGGQGRRWLLLARAKITSLEGEGVRPEGGER